MKQFLLAPVLALAVGSTAYGQAKFPLPTRVGGEAKPQTMAARPAVAAARPAIARPAAAARAATPAPAAPAATPARAADEEAPKYAGFYINNKQVSEISCYGVDELTTVYPFFNALDLCDYFTVTVVAGSYDAKGKFMREYSDQSRYDRSNVNNIRSKFANKGYGIITRTGLLEAFNQNRSNRPGSDYSVDDTRPAFNILKYTEIDSTKVTYSAMFMEVVAFTFNGQYDNNGDLMYTGNLIYISPKIKLKNRVNTARVGARSSSAKKGLAFVPLVGVVANAVKEKPLPEMQNENCQPAGPAVTLTQVKKVEREQIGEEIRSN